MQKKKTLHFSLRKLSTGLTSCMICATTLMSVSTPVFAAETKTQTLNVQSLIKQHAKDVESLHAGNGAQSASLNKMPSLKESKIETPQVSTVTKPKLFENGSTEWGKLNLDDWQTSQDSDGNLELEDYMGDKSHIVIPNSEDYIKARKLQSGKKLVLKASKINKIVQDNQPESIAISNTAGGKVTAVTEDDGSAIGNSKNGDDWNMAFTNHHQSEEINDDDTRTPHQIKDLDAFNPNIKRMDLTNLDISQIHNLTGMLAGAENCETFGDLSKWDTSNITDMSFLFANDPKVQSFGDLSNWNVSNNTDFNSLFEDDDQIKSVGDLSKWNVGKSTNFGYMFGNMRNVVSVGDLSHWDISNAVRLNDMFQEDRALTSVGDLSQWNTGKVQNTVGMFNNATSLKNIGNLDNWDTHSLIDMHAMFAGANMLQNIGKLDNWNVSNVTNMNGVFHGCMSLPTVGDLSKWNTSNVTDMNDMFNLTGIKKLNISNWDFGKVPADKLNGQLGTRSYGNAKLYSNSFIANNPQQIILANNLKNVPSDINATAFNSELGQQIVLTNNDTLLKIQDRNAPNGIALESNIKGNKQILTKPTSPTFYQSNGEGFDKAADNVFNGIKSILAFETDHINKSRKIKGYTITGFKPDTDKSDPGYVDMTEPFSIANGTYIANVQADAPQIAGAQILFKDIDINQFVGDPINKTGKIGDTIPTDNITPPNDYEIAGSIPTGKFGTDTRLVIPIKKKQASAKIQFQDQDTHQTVGKPTTVKGKIGDTIDTSGPKVPEGYKIIGQRPTDKVFGKDSVVTIPVTKADATAQVIFIDQNNKHIGNPINKTGKMGDKIPTNDPVPKGYVLNGKRPTDKVFGHDSIVYIPVKKETAPVQIIFIDPNGKHIGDPINETGNVGDPINANDAKIPDGYVLNGKIPTDKIFGKDKVVYIPIKKPAPKTAGAQIIFIDPNGKHVGNPINKIGKIGDKIPVNDPIPNGYELDGNRPTNKIFGTDKIVYVHVKKPAPKTTDAQIIFIDPNGKHVGTPINQTGKIGDPINTNVPIPNGYELDGKLPTGKKFGTDKVVYIHVKHPATNSRAKIIFVDEKNNTVGTPIDKIGKNGTTIDMSDVSVPSGYELVGKIPTDKVYGKDKLIYIHVKKPAPQNLTPTKTTPAAKPVTPAKPDKSTAPSVAKPTWSKGDKVPAKEAKPAKKAPVAPATKQKTPAAPATKQKAPAAKRPANQSRLPQTGHQTMLHKAGLSLLGLITSLVSIVGISKNKHQKNN